MDKNMTKPSRSALAILGVVIVVAGATLISERYLSGSLAAQVNHESGVALDSVPTAQEKLKLPGWAAK